MASQPHWSTRDAVTDSQDSSTAIRNGRRIISPVDDNSRNADSASGRKTAMEPASSDRQRPTWWQLLKVAAADWSDDNAPRLGAALAYYTIFSLAPTLVIAVAVAAFVFGEKAVSSQLAAQLEGFVGKNGAEAIQSMIVAANQPKSGIMASVLGVAALLFGATGVFIQMKDALNTIFEVQPKPGIGYMTMIKDRVLSFALVLVIGFMLMVTLVVSAVLAAFTKFLGDVLSGPDFIAHGLDLVTSVGVCTFLFALIFKYLPDIKIAWKDVWLGSAVTAVLFTVGKYAIGMYLGMAAVGSAYGAAGSLIVILVWAYYSSQILFFGAELTQAYARLWGSQILPADNAISTKGN